MNVLLLEPHQDDCVLFSAFNAIRHRPLVVTVLSSQLQEDRGSGITNGERQFENEKALKILGCQNLRWPYLDARPDWDAIHERMLRLRDGRVDWDRVFAPALEDGGHEQHNLVGECALDVFGDRVCPYLTYVRGHGKTVGREVTPEPAWIVLKLRALACYGSQIREPTTRAWFMGPLNEYVP